MNDQPRPITAELVATLDTEDILNNPLAPVAAYLKDDNENDGRMGRSTQQRRDGA